MSPLALFILTVVCGLVIASLSLMVGFLAAGGPVEHDVIVDAPPPEPGKWQLGIHGDTSTTVATSALLQVADPQKLEDLRRWEHDYTADITQQIADRGLDEPLVLVIDSRGRVCLWDGHHRLCGAVELELERLPIRFEPTQAIRGYARPLTEVLPPLVLSASRPPSPPSVPEHAVG